MVQRYRFNYVQEMFETDDGSQYNETERTEWVMYKDYVHLKTERDELRQRAESAEARLRELGKQVCEHDGATFYDGSGRERCASCGADL